MNENLNKPENMGKSRSKKNILSKELEMSRMVHETDEYWKLRREFLAKNQEKYETNELNKLISLSHSYINIRVLGCRYPEALMTRVAEMSKGLSVDWCGGWINRRLVQSGTRYDKKYEKSPEISDNEDDVSNEKPQVDDDTLVLRPSWQKRPIIDHQHFLPEKSTDLKSDTSTCKRDAQKISQKTQQSKKENIKPTGDDEEFVSWKERKRQEKTVVKAKLTAKAKEAGTEKAMVVDNTTETNKTQEKEKKDCDIKNEDAAGDATTAAKKKKKSKPKDKSELKQEDAGKIKKKTTAKVDVETPKVKTKKEKKEKPAETPVKAEEVKNKKEKTLKVEPDASETPVLKPRREKNKDQSKTCKGPGCAEKKPKEKKVKSVVSVAAETSKKAETNPKNEEKKNTSKDAKKKKKDGK